MTTRNSYWPGALVTLQGVFQTIAVPPVTIDPFGAITLIYEGPPDVIVTVPQANLTKTATGTWQYLLDTTGFAPGVWAYRFQSGQGNGQAAAEASFIINTSFTT